MNYRLSEFAKFTGQDNTSAIEHVSRYLTQLGEACKENGPLAHLLWILVFDVQHNQIGLMNLQVFVL